MNQIHQKLIHMSCNVAILDKSKRFLLYRKLRALNILEFMEKYPNLESCKADFEQRGEQEGLKCKKCGCTKQYGLQAKQQWRCSLCEFRAILIIGSIM